MLRIKTLLVSAVVAALAIAVPTSASASEWLKNGQPLEVNDTVELEGFIHRDFTSFYGTSSGFGCNIAAEATLMADEPFPGVNGVITTLDTDLESCEGWGALSGCQLVEAAAKPLPVQLAAGEGSEPVIVVNGTSAEWKKFDGCNQITQWTTILTPWTFPAELVLEPDSAGEISSVDMVGDVPQTQWTSEDWLGSASVSPAGVFGIG